RDQIAPRVRWPRDPVAHVHVAALDVDAEDADVERVAEAERPDVIGLDAAERRREALLADGAGELPAAAVAGGDPGAGEGLEEVRGEDADGGVDVLEPDLHPERPARRAAREGIGIESGHVTSR